MKILLNWFATEEEVAKFQRILPKGSKVLVPKSRKIFSRYEVRYDDVADLAPEAEVILGWIMPDGILELATNLKAVIWFRAGCDDLDLAQMDRRGIVVANSRGANSIAVAEYTLAFMLGLAKRVVQNHQDVVNFHHSAPGKDPERRGSMLLGKTVLVVGLGNIGSAIAKRAKAFDMKVMVLSQTSREAEKILSTGHGYPASAANCANPEP